MFVVIHDHINRKPSQSQWVCVWGLYEYSWQTLKAIRIDNKTTNDNYIYNNNDDGGNDANDVVCKHLKWRERSRDDDNRALACCYRCRCRCSCQWNINNGTLKAVNNAITSIGSCGSSTIVNRNIKRLAAHTHTQRILQRQEEALKSKPHALHDPVTYIRRSAFPFPFYYCKLVFIHIHTHTQQKQQKESNVCLLLATTIT